MLKLSKFYCLPVLAIAVGLSAEVSPAASGFPANRQVIAFLTNSIDWYHHCVIDRQIAINPVDLVFLEDNRTGAAQILQLSFDFARAEAVATGIAPSSDQKTTAIVTGPPELTQIAELASKTEAQRRDAIEEIDVINKKLATARGPGRRDLEVALDAAQSRLDVLQAGLATLRQLVEFMQAFTSRETGDLSSTIDDLARTVPEVTSASTVAPQTQASVPSLIAKSGETGIIALSSEVSALGRKLNILDDEIRRTENLRQSSEELRNPLVASINERLPALGQNALQANDLAELHQQKTKLDELAALLKALSPAVMALDKQRVLLNAYMSHLKSWRAAVRAEDEKTWKNLIIRLFGTVLVIAILVIVGAVLHKVTRHHMRDTDRRHIILVTQRIVLWSIIIIIAAFAFASDLTSLATFFGLLAAGLAVALQSFILSAVGYFVLVGRRGIRIGDRVQISGVSGDVTDIGWLQFQVKEIDTRTEQPTGNVVTFSNSIVLASPSTGLSKFNRAELSSAQLEVATKVS